MLVPIKSSAVNVPSTSKFSVKWPEPDTSKFAIGSTTLIPILPSADPLYATSAVSECVPLPNMIPPIFILSLTFSAKVMLVPMIILLLPILLPDSLEPTLYPIKFENDALLADAPALYPMKFEK